MGGREEAKKFLDAENPAQALLNSMGVFVRVSFRWQGWSPAGLKGSASSRGGRWRWDPEQASGTTPSLPKKSSALLEVVPVTGSGSLIAAEIKPSFSFSPIPCPCRCRALRFHVKPSWFWKDHSQFLSRPVHLQSYFRKMMLGALWLNADTKNAP